MISKPVLLPCLAFLTGQLPKQSLGLAKVQSSFAAGEKNFLLWKSGREPLVTSTVCSVPITSEERRVGCQHFSFILLLLWPAQQPEPLSGIRLLMGQQHASFFLPDHTSCNLQTSQAGLGKQGDFTATQKCHHDGFLAPNILPLHRLAKIQKPH